MIRSHSRIRIKNWDALRQPITLFASGEQGFWYDNSDLSTMWQDSAQTTPVTAAGQPVGYQLDKSGNGNHRFQATAGSRPILRLNATTGAYYLETDGVDDGMLTNSIDFTGTDKVSVFAGVRKSADAGTAALLELSASSSANNGTFAIFAPPSSGNPRYTFRSRGTVISEAASGNSFPAPNSAVLSANAEIDTDTILLRANGAQTAASIMDQGTGNYGNYPAYFFRRGGGSLPFNGHEYGNICVGRLTTAAEIAAIEQHLAARTGVTLP